MLVGVKFDTVLYGENVVYKFLLFSGFQIEGTYKCAESNEITSYWYAEQLTIN